MASGVSTRTTDTQASAQSGTAVNVGDLLVKSLLSLASLKFTVGLFALSILLVLFGTLAQDKVGIWDVMNGYFRSFFVWVPFNLIPQKWAPELQAIPGGFWFVGGRTLGVLLIVNLLAAHLIRFKVQAKGSRVWLGWLVFAAGVALCTIIIVYGNLKDGIQDRPWFDWAVLWWAIVIGTVLLSLLCAGFALTSLKDHLLARLLAVVASVSLIALVVGLALSGNRLDDAALRILWQLIQGTIGGLVLLAGCIMVFKKRGGIVLLHLGVGLLLYNELFVSLTNVEEQIALFEGEETNIARDARYLELAVVDRSDSKLDKVLAIPGDLIREESDIELESVPFDLRVEKFMKNSALELIAPMVPSSVKVPDVTQGLGMKRRAIPLPPVAGAESGNQQDVASAYVSVIDKKSKLPVATVLLPQVDFFPGGIHPVEVNGKTYHLSLRSKQTIKPYSVQLLDVERVLYVGSSVPREFWSDFVLHDLSESTSVHSHISMNEPLRYSGETFYQSSYNELPDGRELTVLQVVTNAGWMMPYVACMLVAIGMLAHFSITLVNVLGKTMKAARQNSENQVIEAEVAPGPDKSTKSRRGEPGNAVVVKPGIAGSASPSWLPTLAMLLVALLLVGYGLKPIRNKTEFDLSDAGKLPVTSGGRVMPLDSLARVSLRKLQKKETVKQGTEGKIPPMKWLMDVVAQTDAAEQYRVFKIHNLELLSAINLTRRSGFLYSYAELKPQMAVIESNASAAMSKQRDRLEKLTKEDEAFVDLMTKIRDYEELVHIHRLPSDSTDFEELMNLLLVAAQSRRDEANMPLSVPTPPSERKWETLTYHAVRKAIYDYAKSEAEKLGDDEQAMSVSDASKRWAETVIKDQLYRSGATAVITMELEQNLKAAGKTKEEIDSELRKYVREQDLNQLILMSTRAQYMELEVRRLRAGGMSNDDALAEVARQLIEQDFNTEVFRSVQEDASRRLGQIGRFTELISESLLELFPDGEIVESNNEAATYLVAMLQAYRDNDAETFNATVSDYRKDLGNLVAEGTPLRTVGLEYYYHAMAPFYLATILYLFAFVICPLSWIFTKGSWRRAALSVIVLALILHTVGLLARIWISGRPPVTNLYSSAVFIGWFSVILFLVIERITKVSVGNVLASVVGFLSLLLAFSLGLRDDTFSVMQAVLDTQFWLATHVVCITLGYGTTFVAGMLAIAYIIGGVFVPAFNPTIRRVFTNLTYGTICFALLFSFVGTVLGGLWADDSWGRFWGWDPKENGALIIVIWNALVLHARWGGMVGERGLAVLAIFGNVVTAWSWFGTNQLGFGLHAYGFTEGVLYLLGGWVALNLVLMGLGMIPKSIWASIAPD